MKEKVGIILEFAPPVISPDIKKMGVYPAVIFTDTQTITDDMKKKAQQFMNMKYSVHFYRAKVKQYHSPTLGMDTVEIVEKMESLPL